MLLRKVKANECFSFNKHSIRFIEYIFLFLNWKIYHYDLFFDGILKKERYAEDRQGHKIFYRCYGSK